jgi:hypothetical protein
VTVNVTTLRKVTPYILVGVYEATLLHTEEDSDFQVNDKKIVFLCMRTEPWKCIRGMEVTHIISLGTSYGWVA